VERILSRATIESRGDRNRRDAADWRELVRGYNFTDGSSSWCVCCWL